jgi:hypothetical protein
MALVHSAFALFPFSALSSYTALALFIGRGAYQFTSRGRKGKQTSKSIFFSSVWLKFVLQFKLKITAFTSHHICMQYRKWMPEVLRVHRRRCQAAQNARWAWSSRRNATDAWIPRKGPANCVDSLANLLKLDPNIIRYVV